MPFDSTAVAQALVSELENVAGVDITNDAQAEENIEIIVSAIWDEIEANAVVESGIAVQVDPNTGAGSTQEQGSIS